MGSLKRFFVIEGFYFNGICTFAPVQCISTLYQVKISNLSSIEPQWNKHITR